MSLVPYDDDDDDEPEATRSIEPTKSQLLEKIVELKNKLKESKDQSTRHQKDIVISLLIHLNEKVDSRLNSVHALYSLLFNAIQKLDDDKEMEIPLFTKWLQRGNKLRIISMASKYHAERPHALQPTYLLVKSMKEAEILPENIERKVRELMKSFCELKKNLLPDIEDEEGAVKPLQSWKEEVERVISTQVGLIYEGINMDMLEDSMDKIISTRSFFETFEREANQVAVKYIPFRAKDDDVMNFNWPSDEDYSAWSIMYLNDESKL